MKYSELRMLSYSQTCSKLYHNFFHLYDAVLIANILSEPFILARKSDFPLPVLQNILLFYTINTH